MVLSKRIKLNKLIVKSLFVITFFLFIFSEYFTPLKILDKLHLKHFFLWIGVALMIFDLLLKKKLKICAFKDVTPILISTVVLFVISFVYQIKNNDFKIITIEEIYYLLIPLVFIFLLNFYSDKKIFEFYIESAFLLTSSCFLLQEIFEGSFTFENIKNSLQLRDVLISSLSPFESDCGQFFVLFFIFYVFKRKKIKIILCAFLILLCAKRMNIIVLLLLLLIIWGIRKNEKPKNVWILILAIVFTFSPIIMMNLFTSDEFLNWFFIKFGISLNRFTMTRVEILNVVLKNNVIHFGLGTITEFLEIRNISGQTNLHNDLLRIYLECGIVGLLTFNISYFSFVKNNYSLIVMMFVFVELLVAHFLGPGSITFWILVYLTVYYYNMHTENKRVNYEKK